MEDFAADHDLEVVETSPVRRTVVVRGRLADLAAAFGTELALYEHPSSARSAGAAGRCPCRPSGRRGGERARVWTTGRPPGPHFQPGAGAGRRASPRRSSRTLYDFPAGDGAGQTVAIIELGGGFRTADLTAYWKADRHQPGAEGRRRSASTARAMRPRATRTAPTARSCSTSRSSARSRPRPDRRLLRARTPTRGFLDAITTAVHDSARKPSIVSISWGQAEDNWTAQARTAYDQAFQDAAALGVTICAAAGDDGSADGVSDGEAHVDFPAVEPVRARLRRHEAGADAATAITVGGGVERARPRRHRRRRQPLLRRARLPGASRTCPPGRHRRKRAAACRTWPATPTR